MLHATYTLGRLFATTRHTMLSLAFVTASFSLLSPSFAALSSVVVPVPVIETPSVFVSPSGQLGFGFSVPPGNSTDIFFSLRVALGVSWGAVGLGSSRMTDALVLMVYPNANGDNVTFSPRYGLGNFEPATLNEVTVTLLDGTGISVDAYGIPWMVVRARCHTGCRSWHGGAIDVQSKKQPAIYAIGRDGVMTSNDISAPLPYHQEYGSFNLDMKRTVGALSAPVFDDNSTIVGTTLNSVISGDDDYRGSIHGLIMVISFVIFFPVAAFLLRFRGWKWFAIVQAICMSALFIGFAFGVASSLLYQRSRSYKSAHQILGFITIIMACAQTVLAFVKQRQLITGVSNKIITSAHTWLSIFVTALSLMSVLLGFSLALHDDYGRLFLSLVVLAMICALILRLFMYLHKRQLSRKYAKEGRPPSQQAELTRRGSTPIIKSEQVFPKLPESHDKHLESGFVSIEDLERQYHQDLGHLGPAHLPREFP